MNKAIKDDKCFLCGQPARSATYNRGSGKAFIDCTNDNCGEYLITNVAIESLSSDRENRQTLSKRATSRDQIKAKKEILTISYYGRIIVEMKSIEDVLSKEEISFLGI